MARKDVEVQFARTAFELGFVVGFGPGEYFLDYASVYGGYIICNKKAGSSAEYHPFNKSRLPHKEFLAFLSGLRAAHMWVRT